MLPLLLFLLFIWFTLSAPMLSENSHRLEARVSPCNVRYGWSLNQKDCSAAATKLPVTRISFTGRIIPGLEPVTPRLGESSEPATSSTSRQFTVRSGNCVIGVSHSTGGSIGLNEWGSITAKAFNLILHCVAPLNQGGLDKAGSNKDIDEYLFPELPSSCAMNAIR